ncbi:MAG: orotidine-5'-phosphate decarboxylase [Planctomycetia bacterium]|nr:orotidine-5'-phosphate decarboxylase [Planctomycetia bacterium]
MESFTTRLSKQIVKKKSHLCVGLDISPEGLRNKNASLPDLIDHSLKVIDATIDITACYKPNLAFFERWGADGFKWLERIIRYIGNNSIIIADGKRGDIGNTAKQYAISLFDHFEFDAVTINPYMGSDSIKPFIEYPEKGVFILCRTSNSSASEFQDLKAGKLYFYEEVAKLAIELNINDNIGLVIGATVSSEIRKIRKIAPKLPFLIPGIGAQGGDLAKSMRYGNDNGIAIINVSRGINFAGDLSSQAIKNTTLDYVDKMREIVNG